MLQQTGLSKQCRPRSDATEHGIWSGSTLFATPSKIYNKYCPHKNVQRIARIKMSIELLVSFGSTWTTRMLAIVHFKTQLLAIFLLLCNVVVSREYCLIELILRRYQNINECVHKEIKNNYSVSGYSVYCMLNSFCSINPCHAEYIKMPCPLLISNQSDYLFQVVDTNSHSKWQTVQIQIS